LFESVAVMSTMGKSRAPKPGRLTGMYAAPPFCQRRMRMACWSARMYPAFAGNRFGNRLGIDRVVLVRLHLRLHIRGRHLMHIVPTFPQSTAEIM
jgi:hypothetical protein